jgi:hypothetical protein
MLRRFMFCCAIALLGAGATAWAQEAKPQVRVSAWYWLNSAPKENWEGDFTTMKNLGFTDVLLCWGLDLAGIVTRKTETKQAMEWAHKAGIGVYLIVWQPVAPPTCPARAHQRPGRAAAPARSAAVRRRR